MRQIMRLAKWDVIKLRRRRLPWVFLVLILMVALLQLWSTYEWYNGVDIGMTDVPSGPQSTEGEHPTISVSCLDIRDGLVESRLSGIQPEYRQAALREVESLRDRCPEVLVKYDLLRMNFYGAAILPGSLTFGVKVFSDLGYLFVMILAAMSMGVEYTWGTARQVIAKGCGRGRFLMAKALSLMAVTGIGHLVVLGVFGVISLAISFALTDAEIANDATRWLMAGVYVFKSMYLMLPYIALGMFFAILTSSASSGIVVSVVFYITEAMLSGILGMYLGPDWARFLISGNASLWMADSDLPALNNPTAIYDYIGNFLSTFMPILAYIVVFGCASLWLFQRRDLRPSTGG